MPDLEQIRNEILTEVYEEAEPGLDFEDLLENSDEYPDDWYDRHYLPSERQKEILERYCDKYDLNKKETGSLSWTVLLDFGPRGNKK